ncbi:hypothetical protein PTKIN_Ptkin05aG0108300 [Pterospermum kingtungense]
MVLLGHMSSFGSTWSTQVDEESDTCPSWDETLRILLYAPINDDTTLFFDVIHVGYEENTKPFIGSAKLKLRDVLDKAPSPPNPYYNGPPPPPNPYYCVAPPSGYPYNPYNYNAQVAYGEGSGGYYGQEKKNKGVDALEDHIADEVAEKVEDDLGDNDFNGDDF